MTRAEILETTRQVIYNSVPELEGTELNEDTVINTDAAIDSMGFTLVICRLEAKFDIRIPNRQWQRLRTLGDVVDAIETRLPK
ncbi:MAG: acyl carrier protein [Oscillospiraceae bacterium]|nr:acyl carrier protein [Oscillospiraceae bacterium]